MPTIVAHSSSEGSEIHRMSWCRLGKTEEEVKASTMPLIIRKGISSLRQEMVEQASDVNILLGVPDAKTVLLRLKLSRWHFDRWRKWVMESCGDPEEGD